MTDEPDSKALVPQQTGFATPVALVTEEANDALALSTIAQRRFDLESIMHMAMRHPRDEFACAANMLVMAERPELAEKAMYGFPRGNTIVRGVSVKAARPLRNCWKYIASGWRILRADDDGAHIEGYCHDVQNGIYDTKPAFVKWMQQRKVGYGEQRKTEWVKVTDERERRELLGRTGSICERNAILAVIPPDVVADFIAKCEQTNAKAAEKDLGKNRKQTISALIAAFTEFGVTADMLAAKIGHRVDEATKDDVALLRDIYRGLKSEDGPPVSSYFPREDTKSTVQLDLSNAKTGVPQDPPGGAPFPPKQATTPTPSEPEKPKAGDGKLPLGGSATDAR
jgi:hypothetical protein